MWLRLTWVTFYFQINFSLDTSPWHWKNSAIKLKTRKFLLQYRKYSRQNVISSLFDLDNANYFRCFISHMHQDVQMIHSLLRRWCIISQWYCLWNKKLHLLIIVKTVCSQKREQNWKQEPFKNNQPTKSERQIWTFFFHQALLAWSQNLKDPDDSA